MTVKSIISKFREYHTTTLYLPAQNIHLYVLPLRQLVPLPQCVPMPQCVHLPLQHLSTASRPWLPLGNLLLVARQSLHPSEGLLLVQGSRPLDQTGTSQPFKDQLGKCLQFLSLILIFQIFFFGLYILISITSELIIFQYINYPFAKATSNPIFNCVCKRYLRSEI